MAVIATPETGTRITRPPGSPTAIATPADMNFKVDDLTVLDDMNLPDDMTVGSTGSTTATLTITSQNANAFAVGRQGSTAPALKIDSATASSATGVEVVAAAAGGGVAVRAISSGTNENVTVNAKGSGTIILGSVSTGQVSVAEGAGNMKAKGFTASDGGTVTQITDLTTGVTLNTTTGQITTVTGPSLAAAAEAAFTVTNSTVAVTSVVLVNVATQFNDGEVVAYVKSIAAGSFVVGLTNVGAAAVSAGTAVINFIVFGGSAT